jgi:hypothetical protein
VTTVIPTTSSSSFQMARIPFGLRAGHNTLRRVSPSPLLSLPWLGLRCVGGGGGGEGGFLVVFVAAVFVPKAKAV